MSFAATLNGLRGGVIHYFRAAASHSTGIVLGNILTFSTPVFSKVNVALPSSSYSGAPAWVDYDNDGLLDLFLLPMQIPQLFRNTGSGFTNVPVGLTNITEAAAWGDYDNDGRLDLLLGRDGGFQIARNTGSGFTVIDGSPLVPFGFGGTYSATWGDFDNDGRLDVLFSAITNDFADFTRWYEFTEVWRNTGSGFVRVQTELPAVHAPSLVDYDNDGRLDVLLINDAYGSPQFWRNTGGNFVQVPLLMPPENDYGSIAVADYDSDGRVDFFLMGAHYFTNGDSQAVSELWRNTGTGITNVPIPGLTPVYGKAAWGDFDNDGRLDLFLTGTTNSYATNGAFVQLWRNTGNGFVHVNAGLPGRLLGDVALGDFDKDGRLDIALNGYPNLGTNSTIITEIWRNNTPLGNTPPTAPTSLSVATAGNVVTFSWDAGSDAQTPAAGLSYALRIGTSPGGSDIVAPSASSTGWRRTPRTGNAQNNRFWFSTALPFGQPLYWSVQSIDSAFAGSPFAPERSLKLLQPSVAIVPLTATNIVPGDVNSDGALDDSELQAVLAYYFANSAWLQMTNVAGLGGTNVFFALTNSLAVAFSVEVTTNLMDWLFLGPAVPRYEFTDSNAPAQPQRYYRLRWP